MGLGKAGASRVNQNMARYAHQKTVPTTQYQFGEEVGLSSTQMLTTEARAIEQQSSAAAAAAAAAIHSNDKVTSAAQKSRDIHNAGAASRPARSLVPNSSNNVTAINSGGTTTYGGARASVQTVHDSS